MFKTKGFSANNSLKRRAVIVDAPDLPPEECEFYITGSGIADTDKVEMPDTPDAPVLDFEVEELYEESDDTEVNDSSESLSLLDVKGIGKGTSDNLQDNGINTIDDLIEADPDELSVKISGVSSKKVMEWQISAKTLIKT